MNCKSQRFRTLASVFFGMILVATVSATGSAAHAAAEYRPENITFDSVWGYTDPSTRLPDHGTIGSLIDVTASRWDPGEQDLRVGSVGSASDAGYETALRPVEGDGNFRFLKFLDERTGRTWWRLKFSDGSNDCLTAMSTTAYRSPCGMWSRVDQRWGMKRIHQVDQNSFAEHRLMPYVPGVENGYMKLYSPLGPNGSSLWLGIIPDEYHGYQPTGDKPREWIEPLSEFPGTTHYGHLVHSAGSGNLWNARMRLLPEENNADWFRTGVKSH
jgi:hypothetical protein